MDVHNVKESIDKRIITILNNWVPRNKVSKYMKQKLTELKGETDKPITRDFSHSFLLQNKETEKQGRDGRPDQHHQTNWPNTHLEKTAHNRTTLFKCTGNTCQHGPSMEINTFLNSPWVKGGNIMETIEHLKLSNKNKPHGNLWNRAKISSRGKFTTLIMYYRRKSTPMT